VKLISLPYRGNDRWINPEQITRLRIQEGFIQVYMADGDYVQTDLTLEQLRELLAEQAT
jgi:hypothetical protein